MVSLIISERGRKNLRIPPNKSGVLLTPRLSDTTYQLYDPDLRIKTETDKYLVDGYRIGTVIMEEIGENTFRGYMKQVPIHSASLLVKHKIFAQDTKLYDGTNHMTAYTPYGVTVQYAYDTSIHNAGGYEELHFKMGK